MGGGSHPNSSPSLGDEAARKAHSLPAYQIDPSRAPSQSANQPHPLRARTRSLQPAICKPLTLLTRHGGRIHSQPQGQARPGQTRAGQAEPNGGCTPPHRNSTPKLIPSGLGRLCVASASQAGRVRAKGDGRGGGRESQLAVSLVTDGFTSATLDGPTVFCSNCCLPRVSKVGGTNW